MAVYVDRTQEYHSGMWCHMWADSLDELHAIASRIGLKRAWFQDRQHFPHYDLRPSKRRLAVNKGAIEATRKQMIEHLRANRESEG